MPEEGEAYSMAERIKYAEQPAGADPKWTPATAKQAGVPAALPHAVAGAPATNRTATICEAPAAHGGYRVQVLQRSKRIAIEVYDPVSKEQVLLVCNLHESGVLIYLPERLPTRFRRDGLVYYPETHPCVNSWIRFGDGSYVVCCDWANKAHIAAGQVDKFESVPPSIVRDYPAWTEWLIARLPTLCSQTTIYNALRDADLVGGFGAAGACELLTEHSIPPELPARPLLESAVNAP
ncbi:hypothetical protein Rsub_06055 [Raphidocelis subcapitata]|uniref:Uncharacterized protein n=1 Tax=Raphidocelis subcapitata TaxID=307507 RepID=A0A2V0P774_9CHLO|nr:hypothetical protein Rsub_06055 [Raphidocelis subcapitata]|eukprot:GBF93723.1 hypothetical protein Rsub_06055 [Raphidocelis subcapitata]